jgi:hypothetical protein
MKKSIFSWLLVLSYSHSTAKPGSNFFNLAGVFSDESPVVLTMHQHLVVLLLDF